MTLIYHLTMMQFKYKGFYIDRTTLPNLVVDKILSSSDFGILKKDLNYLNSQRILKGREASLEIQKLLTKSNSPVLISRFGTTEAEVLVRALKNPKKPISPALISNLYYLSGVFPQSQDEARAFASTYSEAAKEIDLLGVRCSARERNFWRLERQVARLVTIPKLMDISVLTPFTISDPWVNSLHAKKVLVIHPFSESIQKQFKKKNKLFESSSWLPDFNLVVYRPSQTLGNNSKNFLGETWHSVLNRMNSEISEIDFDLALVGAGAYGLPISSAIKKSGRSVVHVGGSLQLLFGIKGKRWNSESTELGLTKYSTDDWVNPVETERPDGYHEIEGGAYW